MGLEGVVFIWNIWISKIRLIFSVGFKNMPYDVDCIWFTSYLHLLSYDWINAKYLLNNLLGCIYLNFPLRNVVKAKAEIMPAHLHVVLCNREIWARFLAFESNIGDLASILKVERRRFMAFKDEYEGKETALLVDRYKFMDLYPCSPSELKALGYKVR